MLLLYHNKDLTIAGKFVEVFWTATMISPSVLADLGHSSASIPTKIKMIYPRVMLDREMRIKGYVYL